jgi:hypothetical protein
MATLTSRSGPASHARGPMRLRLALPATAAVILTLHGGLLAQQGVPQPASDVRVLSGPSSVDTIAPTVSVTAPSAGTSVSGVTTVAATASDNVGVAGVQFLLDGAPLGDEDLTSPYALSWDTTAHDNGEYTLAARARDAVGNQTTAAVIVSVVNPSAGLRISSVDGPDTVPAYDKVEVTFTVSGTVATNVQMPYDPEPPPGIPADWGITVDAEFSPDAFQTVLTVPAFLYQEFDYQVKANRDWFLALDQYTWKARFTPPTAGAWQYRLRATDASGTTTSSVHSVTVAPSTKAGFVRVSSRDPRYFEFENGTAFAGLGYNGGIDWFNPVRSSASRFALMGQNGVQLSRIWLMQSGLNGSAWNPWYGLRGDYGGYIPRTGLTPAGTPATVKLRLSYAEDGSGSRNTGFQSSPAIKRNTTYHFTVRYRAFDITGPRNAGYPNYGFVLKMQNPANGNWHTNCYDAGTGNSTGQVISRYADNTESSGEALLEGNWHSGNNDFLPPFYMALENVRATNPQNGRNPSVYISSVEIRERRSDGSLVGPNVAPKPSMQHHTYFEQRFSYAFDRVLQLAEQNGVFLKVVILEKDEDILSWIRPDGSFGSADGNNFYGAYRNVTAVRWLQQAWWRYLQARWGYSPSIHSWELVNEGPPTNDRHYVLADEFGKYMRQFTPNHHMVTTSFWHSLPVNAFWDNTSYPNVDYVDLHAYVSTSQVSDFNIGAAKDPVVRQRCGTNNTCFKASMKNDAALYRSEHSLQARDRLAGKPIVRGEAGLDSVNAQVEDQGLGRDSSGVWLHNLVWSGVDAGGMYDLYWWLQNIRQKPGPDGSTANGLREIFRTYQDFMADVPLANGGYQDVAAVISNASNVRVLGQKDASGGRAHAWIQNRKHIWCAVVGGVSDCPYSWDGSRLSGTVTLSGFPPNASYQVQWLYFDASGSALQPDPAVATTDGGGQMVLDLDTLPATVTDAAVKIGPQP